MSIIYRLLLIFLFLSLNIIAQQPDNLKGRYFKNIKGTTWLSNIETVDVNMNGVSLSLLTYPHDSLKNDVTLWIFSDKLIIKHYDATTKKDSLLLICNYENDEELKRFKIKFNDKTSTESVFNYVSTSNGGNVEFIRIKK